MANEMDDVPLEEFNDPQSAIASILQQMQGAADRSRPPPLETVQNANRPMPATLDLSRRQLSPDELLAALLGQGNEPGTESLLRNRR
jgi:hypothetical protein